MSNYNSIWSDLCANYVLFARNMLAVGKAVSDKLWLTDMVIITKIKYPGYLIENNQMIPIQET